MAQVSRSVLCVDDEPHVFDGFEAHTTPRFRGDDRNQRRGWSCHARTDGGSRCRDIGHAHAGDEWCDVSATKVREQWPETTRLLLTRRSRAGRCDRGGQRRTNIPLPHQTMRTGQTPGGGRRGGRQHALVIAEKRLLQQTVLGSLRALVDVLALVNPIAFGRGGRIKRLATELAAASGLPPGWELEAAALLSQVGYVSLPIELVEKAVGGEPLSADEELLLAEVPKVTQALLAGSRSRECRRDRGPCDPPADRKAPAIRRDRTIRRRSHDRARI